MAEPYYVTANELRDHLSVTNLVLDDAAATVLIEDAEDLIDDMLGAGCMDDITGRLIVEADVEAWQFIKLKRATLKIAGAFYQQPDLLGAAQRWQSQSGPDFSVSGPTGSALGALGASVDAILNQSGLRRMTTTTGSRTTGLGSRPPWYPLVYNDPDED